MAHWPLILFVCFGLAVVALGIYWACTTDFSH